MLLGICIGALIASVCWGVAYFRLVRTVQEITASMRELAARPINDDEAIGEMEKRWKS